MRSEEYLAGMGKKVKVLDLPGYYKRDQLLPIYALINSTGTSYLHTYSLPWAVTSQHKLIPLCLIRICNILSRNHKTDFFRFMKIREMTYDYPIHVSSTF